MGREESSGWGTHVYLWWIHFDIWQNQYNIVKLKNKIIKKKRIPKEKGYSQSLGPALGLRRDWWVYCLVGKKGGMSGGSGGLGKRG